MINFLIVQASFMSVIEYFEEIKYLLGNKSYLKRKGKTVLVLREPQKSYFLVARPVDNDIVAITLVFCCFFSLKIFENGF